MPRETLGLLRQRVPKAKPFLMYGLTEAFRSTYLPPEEVDRRPDSIGKAIPNAEILVLREDGTECAPDEPGELVHRGALVGQGYWNDAEKTAERYKLLPGIGGRQAGCSCPSTRCSPVGGELLTTLAARVGQTPFYAYDRGLLRQRVAQLRAALPAAVKLHYAMKANPMPAVVGLMAGLVDGIDVASAGELKVALDAGADPAEISFAGPGKRDPELRRRWPPACW
jgi:acyl-CoA synthetase (AMP-forming)/AMP-acid ligase II